MLTTVRQPCVTRKTYRAQLPMSPVVPGDNFRPVGGA